MAAKKKASKKKQYDNTNSGALWANQLKLSDKHPDYTGTLDVEGVIYRVAAWDRDNSDNEKAPCLSFRLTLKEDS